MCMLPQNMLFVHIPTAQTDAYFLVNAGKIIYLYTQIYVKQVFQTAHTYIARRAYVTQINHHNTLSYLIS
jgi:hypothetical protein